ncbi:DUF4123 domain-containing protein [Burkholderia multivorans]|nr:DUF4123 domain-containing protein [Burkholderia multivorans]PRE68827.1 DUF4123 domain-containing protein [Burkholderia multivorans]PRF16177.1 DUF4123 domain-containing protein [Burkholderia multivorans]
MLDAVSASHRATETAPFETAISVRYMQSQFDETHIRLFALIDGAAAPERLQAVREQAGVKFVNVYEGLPEAESGLASLFLVPVEDPEAAWVAELDRIDRHSPCLSLVWGRVPIDQLAVHLRAFLFADIGDGVTAMVRFFDPRNTGAVFSVWGESIRDIFMGPIDRWMYRGRHPDWQRVENDTLHGAKICRSILIELEQEDVDTLTAHTEPDELLAVMIDAGLVDGALPYLDRLADFMPRYERALNWMLTEPTDKLGFCRETYRYGIEFDRNPQIAEALDRRAQFGTTFYSAMDEVPSHVWRELDRDSRSRSRSSSGTSS